MNCSYLDIFGSVIITLKLAIFYSALIGLEVAAGRAAVEASTSRRSPEVAADPKVDLEVAYRSLEEAAGPEAACRSLEVAAGPEVACRSLEVAVDLVVAYHIPAAVRP